MALPLVPILGWSAVTGAVGYVTGLFKSSDDEPVTSEERKSNRNKLIFGATLIVAIFGFFKYGRRKK